MQLVHLQLRSNLCQLQAVVATPLLSASQCWSLLLTKQALALELDQPRKQP